MRHRRNPTDNQKLADALVEINAIAQPTAGGGYLFRGENRCFELVSSGLYRQYVTNRSATANVSELERIILREAKRFAGDGDDEWILSQLQHFESGLTNLIDFTTDLHVALFFACDGAYAEDGRIVLLNSGNAEIVKPLAPANRAIAQKSVFVRARSGFINFERDFVVPAGLKFTILGYLADSHGITAESLYNDLHGFMRHWSMHEKAFEEFLLGERCAAEKNYNAAVAHYNDSLLLVERYYVQYCRGNAYLALMDYDQAIRDFDLCKYRALEDADVAVCARAFNGCGVAKYKKRLYADAIQDFRSAAAYFSMKYDPPFVEEADIYANLVAALMAIGDWDSAIEELRRGHDYGVNVASSYRKWYGTVEEFVAATKSEVPEDLARMLSNDWI